MIEYTDGSRTVIRRDNQGLYVEHIARNGVVSDTMRCDTLAEARAALYYGPERW